MKKEIYKAAARGDVEFLKEAKAKDVEAAAAMYSDDDLLGLTTQGNNIIHVAAQFGQLDFIKFTLECFPASTDQRKLICETNSDGDTPLHLAAKQRTQALVEYLITSYHRLFSSDDKETPPPSPWRVQNLEGNTPLHVALMNGGKSIKVATYLLGVGPEVAAYANLRKQTPLHLAVIYHNQGTEKSSIKIINSLNSQGAALSTRNSFSVHENVGISLSLVRSLLKKNSEVCCLCDSDGMTPLLRAAIRSNLPVVDAIINECPESIEVCDPKGKNLLHYIRFPTSLEARKFLEKQEIPVLLIDKQDHDGNTPMHIAVMNHDFRMVKAMVEHNANFAIENKEGVSVQTLFDQLAIKDKLDVSADAQIESKSNKLRDLVKKENEKEVIIDELMSKDLYEAVGNGEWDRLTEIMVNDEKQFLSRLPDGSNIIHLAIQGLKLYKFAEDFSRYRSEAYPEEELIMDALEKYPVLFCQTNRLGQTPLHLELFHRIIRKGTPSSRKIKEELMNLKGRGELPLPLPPWKVKDVQGNTILHCAIKHRNYEFAEYLIEIDANLAGEVNHFKQTPLHLLCQTKHYNPSFIGDCKDLAKLIVEKDVSTVYSRDVEGFTPLLRAAQHGNTRIATEILKQHPQSIRQIDPHGQNYFHHLELSFFYLGETKKNFCEAVPQMEMVVLITQKDDQGNAPFDLAVEKREFKKAQILIECCGDLQRENLDHWLRYHKKDTRDIIYGQQISGEFEKFLKSRGVDIDNENEIKLDRRSTYGVRGEDVKEYMNPMGVVAALLATVTFTAAFTVPGGYKGDTGIPNLGKQAAFQVFMFSDVVGMCSSMMVLFCLLWLLSRQENEDDAFEEEEKQVMLVDMTIKLLLISFYATLVAFMTGVYVTTISETRWLAIFTCVLCSFLILLMRRPQIKYLSILLRVLPFMCQALADYFKKLYFENKFCCKPKNRAAGHNRDQQELASGSTSSS